MGVSLTLQGCYQVGEDRITHVRTSEVAGAWGGSYLHTYYGT
jgi:hypothetical protein